MSNRKTRKKKQLAEKRNKARNAQMKELEELRSKALELESKITKQRIENFKQLNIRNLKIFANACNFAAPFVISAGITVGVFRLFGGGLPFHSDEITKYKAYNLDFQTNGYVTMDDKYRTNRWFENSLPSNTLLVYTPWEEQDGQYVRFKREYDVGKLTTLDLYNAVLNEDYNYISENLKDYKEEKQVVNKKDPTDGNNYFFEASLHMLDEEDVLKYNETDLKNMVITIIELVLGLGIGGAIAYFRDFEFLYELREVNDNYSSKILSIKPMKKELKDINEKILSITRTKGG